MAAPLMKGFTMDDYVLADKLGYSREQFEGMGQSQMRDMLTKKTPQKSYVTPTSVIPSMPGVASRADTRTPAQVSSDKAIFDQAALDDAEMAALNPDAFNATNNPEAYNIGEQDSAMNSEQLATQALTDQRNMDTALKGQQLADAQAFDWMGAANVGFQGLNTAMQVGMYGDQKDYMKNVNAGLEQNMSNAQATHDNRETQQQNLGSTFSRNA